MKQRSLPGRWGLSLMVVSLLLVALAFLSENWLASDHRFRGARLQRLGLWVQCFRSVPSPGDPQQLLYFSGCRWLFERDTVGYDAMRSFLMPGFFVAVQFFYTLVFICALLAGGLLAALFLCVDPDRQPLALRAMALLMLLSSLFGFIAIVVFGSMARSYPWTSDNEHNYLSWSYAIAVTTVFIQTVVSILLVNDARITEKRLHVGSSQARALDQM